MSARGCLIVEGEDEWCIVFANETRSLAKTSGIDTLVATVNELLANSKGANAGCIIAPASNSCFFSLLDLEPDFDIRDRTTLIYELENHLPIDAESMSADFATLPLPAKNEPSSTRKSVSAVAVEVNDWKPLADKLETEGIPVTNIIPSVALAVTSIHENNSLSGISNIILCHAGHADMITLDDDRILSWKYSKLDAASLKRHKFLEIPESDEILVVGGTESQIALVRENAGTAKHESTALLTHQIHGANAAICKPTSIHFNLRRDKLASEDPLRPISRQLSWLGFAVATLLCLIIAGSWWRSTRIEERISDTLGAQATAFKKSFPDTRVPSSLLRRVRSEHSRIMGSRNASKQIEAPGSAAEVMGALLASLPTNIRVRINSIDIRNGKLDLTFQVQRTVDAGAIAEALSQAGFDVSPPVTTQKDAKTFDSIIQAQWQERDSAGTNRSPQTQSNPVENQERPQSLHTPKASDWNSDPDNSRHHNHAREFASR